MTDQAPAQPRDPLAKAPRGLIRFARFLDKLSYELIIILLVALFLIVVFSKEIVYNVPAGHVGVFWSRFGGGTRIDTYLGEGIHFVLPWDKVYIYDVRLRQDTTDLDVLMDDGLQVKLSVAWRYRLIAPSAPLMHQYIGVDYNKVLLQTDVAQRVRDVLAVHRAEDLYGSSRVEIQDEIRNAVMFNLHNKFNPPKHPDWDAIVLEDVIIRNVQLPPELLSAIVRKNEALQTAQEYNYRLEIERKEAERRRIEALGIRGFQEIVNSNLSESYLRWRGIEATMELAKSPNAKIIVIGSGSRGLPIILNPDAPAVAAEPSQAAKKGK
jgi:prohibitin 1